jgi:hypothetical protein
VGDEITDIGVLVLKDEKRVVPPAARTTQRIRQHNRVRIIILIKVKRMDLFFI